MSDSIRLSSLTLNCPEPGTLADFYAVLTGGSVTFRHASWATMIGPGGRIDFQAVDDFVRPDWPNDPAAARVHFDFLVDDLAATEERAISAGATRLDFQPNAAHCLVFADPIGHIFCLTTVDELG
ncbi:VOC family protein [Arthrobacter sp.]|uniref:VOC family protein n=1 Tax=Arthrobacter sp. TaxID=1667 RepID=UPI003A95A9A0